MSQLALSSGVFVLRCRRAASFLLPALVLLGVLSAAAPAHADELVATTVTYVGPSSVQVGREAVFGAEIRDSSGDLVTTWTGVRFEAYMLRDGYRVGQSTFYAQPTGTPGQVSIPWAIDGTPGFGAGDYRLEITFEGDTAYAPSSVTVPLTVLRNPTGLSFSEPSVTVHRGDVLDLRAVLTSLDGIRRTRASWFDGNLPWDTVHVELLDGSGTAVWTADPQLFAYDEANDWAIVHWPGVTAPAGSYTLRATFAEDNWSYGSTAGIPVEVLRSQLRAEPQGARSHVAGEPAVGVGAWMPPGSPGSGRPDPDGTEFTFRLTDGETVLAEATATTLNNHASTELAVAGIPPGDGYRLEISSPGNAGFEPYTASVPYVVYETAASLAWTYDGPASPKAGDTVRWDFRLTRADDGTPLAGQPVLAYLSYVGNGPYAFFDTLTTDADGRVSMVTDLHVKGGYYHPFAHFDGAGPVGSGYASPPTIQVAAATDSLTVDAPASVPFLDSATPSVRLLEGPGRAVGGEDVRLVLTDPNGMRRVDVVRRTTGDGRVTLPATTFDRPGTWRLTATYAGNSWLPAASAVVDIATEDVPPTLTVGGPVTGTYGQPVTFTTSLEAGGVPLEGRTLTFTLPDGTTATAVTARDGGARVTWTVTTAPGDGNVSVSFAGGPGLLAESATAPFTTGWQHTFTDAGGAGTVRLNPATRDLAVEVPGWSSGRVRLDEMPVREVNGHRVVDVAWRSGTTSVTGHFDLTDGSFAATVTAPSTRVYALAS